MFFILYCVEFSEQLHKHINEKVNAGELPQATFNQWDKEDKKKTNKTKISKETVHLDRRKSEKTRKGKFWNV